MSQPRRDAWPPEALALFAEYAPRREPHRPLECNDGPRCWVRDGPPSMSRRGPASHCTGCGGRPRPVISRRHMGVPVDAA
jgi:hypothetical protein